jgi:tripeptidyl-peptidase-1
VASPLPASPLPDGTALTLANCDTNTTRECLKALYQIPDATTASPGNSLGLFEQAEYYSQKDLDMFFTAYAPNIPNGTYPIPAFIDGGMAPAPQRDAGLEPDVDIAIALSLIYPQNVTLYQTDDIPYGQQLGFTGLNGLFNTFFDALDGVSANPPNVPLHLKTDGQVILSRTAHIMHSTLPEIVLE